ncbi:AMP-binding protein [Oligoflexus tunisiensis]|uniref:AMP-binding protein n=1 Tax=Oligoflexus tunisiensis TaxID=708132 RepID=UPI00114D2CA9|nr:AMP-binding protein [Oligoflexus tunisiensis]
MMARLSSAQEGIWIGHALAADKAIYNTAECLEFATGIDPVLLQKAVQLAVSEAECLQAFYGEEGTEALRMGAGTMAPVRVETLAPETAALDYIRSFAQTDLQKPFLLATELPCAFVIFSGSGKTWLYAKIHHIAIDGFGYSLLFQRIVTILANLQDNSPVSQACDIPDFRDVLVEEEARLAQGYHDKAREFWASRLDGSHVPASFAEGEAELMSGFHRQACVLPDDLWQGLAQLEKSARTSRLEPLLATLGLHLLLATGERRLVLGLPVMNRMGSRSLQIPCMQMNIIPLCVELRDEDTLIDLSQRLQAEIRATRKYHFHRYEALARDMRKAGRKDRLFATVINIQPFARNFRQGPISAISHSICPGPVENFSLGLAFDAAGAGAQLFADGHPKLYSQARLAQLQTEFLDLLQLWLPQPESTVAGILQTYTAKKLETCLISGESHQVAAGHFMDWIDTQCELHGEKPALITGDVTISYRVLRERMEAGAQFLLGLGLQPGDRVGLIMSRSTDAILAMLSVLRAGCICAPLDPGQPWPRQEAILNQLNPALLILDQGCDHEHFKKFSVVNGQDLQATGSAQRQQSADGTALIMFTSGSTGNPKGVKLSSAALNHFISAANQRYKITAADQVLQFAPLHFDASLEEIFLSLCHGATLVLRSASMLDSMARFAEFLAAHRITVLDLPTAFWNEWVLALQNQTSWLPESLHTVIIGGEAVHRDGLRKWFQVAPASIRLINTYGPTEATVVFTTVELNAAHAANEIPPIGEPLPALQILIRDKAGRPSDEGELLLLGPTLANGYLENQDDPFTIVSIQGEPHRAYATRDRVRRDATGLVYLGRLDHEFKISGVRIQPAEVEAQLLKIPGLDEVCVQGLHPAPGVKRLVAFIGGLKAPTRQDIRQALQEQLPGPMIPSDFIFLPHLPKNASGKIDRPRLVEQYLKAERSPNMQSHQTLEVVGTVWQSILGIRDLNPEDNFFDLGGQSLQTIQVANRLSEAFHLVIRTSDIFQNPVLADLCQFIEANRNTALSEMEENARLIPLSQAPHALQLYLVPGIGADSTSFLALSRVLGHHVAIKVLEANALPPERHLQDIARQFADLIAHDAGAGTVHIGGHSFGGILAYETARLLHEKGRTIILHLMDTYFTLDRDPVATRDWIFPAGLHGQAARPDLIQAQLDMLRSYQPRERFTGAVRRYRARDKQGPWARQLDAAADADRLLFAGPLFDQEVSGDHFSMLSLAHVHELGQGLHHALTTLSLESIRDESGSLAL